MSTKSLDQIKNEMKARLDELTPLVEEAKQIEAILEDTAWGHPERRGEEPAPRMQNKPRRVSTRKRAPRRTFNSFEHRVNSYYKRMREELTPYFTLGQFAAGASFDQRNVEAMSAVDYLVDNGYVVRLDVEDVPHAQRPKGWWFANNLYKVVDKQQKVQFTKEVTAVG